MKILWQNEHYPDVTKGGGGAINTYYIVSALQRLGHETVILARGDNGQRLVEDVRGTKVQRVPPPKMPDLLWPAWPLLEPRYVSGPLGEIGAGFEALIGIDSWFAIAAKRLFPEKPLIYRVEGSRKSHDAAVDHNGGSSSERVDPKRRLLRRLMNLGNDWMERRAWKACDAVVVKSEFMKRELTSLDGVTAAKIAVIPNGVDFNRYACARPSPEITSRIGKSDAETTVVVYSGRLVRMKNVSLLLRAFARMNSTRRCILAILGEGDERRALEREAGELGIADRVRFLGYRSDVERYLAAADIFVLPSTYEPFGNALVEAMAAGLPCIALKPNSVTIRTASAEIIRNGETGLLVTPQDLSRNLDLLVSDPELRKRIGSAAQADCRRRYDWITCARAYLRLLDPTASDSEARPQTVREAMHEGRNKSVE